MNCKNISCLWNYQGMCCPEDEDSYKKAQPDKLDCPSSLRKDFETQLYLLAEECANILLNRNMKELIEIKKFMEKQRSGG